MQVDNAFAGDGTPVMYGGVEYLETHGALSHMAKLTASERFPVRRMEAIRGEMVELVGASGVTHVQFRRFAGCPICNLHLRSFATRADELSERGIREVVVFHSSKESLSKYQDDLPFPLVADPRRVLYKRCGVEASLLSVLHPQALASGARGWLKRMRGFALGGGPWGLPADFLIEPSGEIAAAKYGRHADDQWTVDEVVALGRPATSKQSVSPA